MKPILLGGLNIKTYQLYMYFYFPIYHPELLNNEQSMQDLFTMVNINDNLQFLQEYDFYNKI